VSVDTDLAAMLEGWDSQTVVIGSVAARGILDEVDSIDFDRSNDPVKVRKTVLRVQRALFPAAARGDTAVVGGVSYQVSDILVGDPSAMEAVGRDGRELILVVRKV
jgi:hypothetical protein